MPVSDSRVVRGSTPTVSECARFPVWGPAGVSCNRQRNRGLLNVAVEGIFDFRLFSVTGSQQKQEGNDAHRAEQSSDDFGQRDDTGFDHGVATIPKAKGGASVELGPHRIAAKYRKRTGGPALAQQPPMLPSEPPISRVSTRRPRILLVDDDPSVIRGLLRVLRKYRPELQVNTASGAAQAIEALSEWSYDLVLTDLQMPGGGGRAVLDVLAERHPETARIVHSSQLGSVDTLHGRQVHAILGKPASESEIVAAVDSALQRVASEAARRTG